MPTKEQYIDLLIFMTLALSVLTCFVWIWKEFIF